MKKIFLTMLLILGVNVFANGNDILGLWITEKASNGNQIIVEIYRTKDGKYNGKISKLTVPVYTEGEYKGQEKMDLKNKNEKLRNRKLVGIDFVYSFSYNGDKKSYEGGNIYNPENGKVYYSSMQLNSDGTLSVKGSLDKGGLIGKKQTWKRYK